MARGTNELPVVSPNFASPSLDPQGLTPFASGILFAGLVLDPIGLEPATVREASARLLSGEGHRKAARQVMAEISALPGQETAVARIEELARRGTGLTAPQGPG